MLVIGRGTPQADAQSPCASASEDEAPVSQRFMSDETQGAFAISAAEHPIALRLMRSRIPDTTAVAGVVGDACGDHQHDGPRCDDVTECVSTVGRSLPLEDSHLWLRLKRKLEIRAGDASTWRLAIIVEVNQSLQQVSLGSCLPSGRRDPHGGPGGGGMSALLHL